MHHISKNEQVASNRWFYVFIFLIVASFFLPARPVFADLRTVSNVHELMATSGKGLNDNSTILIKDGVYVLPRRIIISANHVTFKSFSGKGDSVILKGRGPNGRVKEIFSIEGSHINIENLTVGEVSWHAIQIHGENNADDIKISNVRFYDTGQQMLKGSFNKKKPDNYTDVGLVQNCLFEFTKEQAFRKYTGGIDIHHGEQWTVKNCTFRNIRTKGNGLTADGAIHFWTDSRNVVIKGNKIINCDRGILFGLDNSSFYGGIIINNFIQAVVDTGIYLCNTENVSVFNNNVFIDSTYPHAIEYRFKKTKNLRIINNLTNRIIISRNHAKAMVVNNVTNAKKQWFVNAAQGDLHLFQRIASVSGKGIRLPEVSYDIDGEKREKNEFDIGADQNDKLASKKISTLVLHVNVNEVMADGVSPVRLKVTAEYADHTSRDVEPDRFNCSPDDKNYATIKKNRFCANVGGTYRIMAELGKLTSNPVTIKAKSLLDRQVSGVAAWTRAGQTFIVFNEITRIMPSTNITYGEFFRRKKSYKNKITYNIYRSTGPIHSVENMKPVAKIGSFSGWDESFYGKYADRKYENEHAIRYVVKEGEEPLAVGKGIWVCNSAHSGKSYYAITAVVDGHENTSISIGRNATRTPVSETVGQGLPVLQRIRQPPVFDYVKHPKLYFYVRWESPPNASVQGKPFDYLVAIPPHLKHPAPLGIHMHAWGGDFLKGYAWWTDAENGAILLSSNEIPYDWWTGYHEKIFTKHPPKSEADWQKGVVHPYTTNRLWSFVKFLNEKSPWEIDMHRIFTAGISMGGSGSLMMAIRYPDRIAWARSWVGVHVPLHSPQFASSYEKVWGDPQDDVRFENGAPVWDYYNDAKYLITQPKGEVGFLTFSNGKNDHEIGWQQAVEFVNALEKTRRPFLFIWGQHGHGQRTVMPKTGSERDMPIDIATNKSLPAFTNCSLDDNPGNGDPKNGDPSGQINRWLYWETKDALDMPERWEMTVGLMNKAPKNTCRVDITPRRIQQFKPHPGQKVNWENRSLSGSLIAHGETKVDQNGLITIQQTTVSTNKNRIIITIK